MKINRLRFLMAVAAGFALTACTSREVTADYDVIPLPQQIDMADGDSFVLDKSTVIAYTTADSALRRDSELLPG